MADKPVSKVEDVFEGVESYGSLMAEITQGHPIQMLMGAHWLNTMLWKLVEWGALTEQELREVHAMVADETTTPKVADQELVWTVGI